MKLYHYTSINTLALILKNQTIRFSSLPSVNDKLEGQTNDFGDVGQYVFVSCWTENEEESLPLWNMYTDKMRGVRIELETPIFNLYKLKDISDKSLISEADLMNNYNAGIFILAGIEEPFIKIKYSDDKDKLNPKIHFKKKVFKIGEKLEKVEVLDILKVGEYKSNLWHFENEWRFRVFIFPVDSDSSKSIVDRYSPLIAKKVKPSIDSYNLKIKDDIFRNMKIRKGPKLNNGDTEIIEALVNSFNNNAEIQESKLKNIVR